MEDGVYIGLLNRMEPSEAVNDIIQLKIKYNFSHFIPQYHELFSCMDDNPRSLHDFFPGVKRLSNALFVKEFLLPFKCQINPLDQPAVLRMHLYSYFIPVHPVFVATILAIVSFERNDHRELLIRFITCTFTLKQEAELISLNAFNDSEKIVIIKKSKEYFKAILQKGNELLKKYGYLKQSFFTHHHDELGAWMAVNPTWQLGFKYISVMWWYMDMRKHPWNDAFQNQRVESERQTREINQRINEGLASNNRDQHVLQPLFQQQKAFSLLLERNRYLYKMIPEEIHAGWMSKYSFDEFLKWYKKNE